VPGLTAYHPLEAVFKFHEPAETWILRRYNPQVQAVAGAERARVAFSESAVAVFPERRPSTTQNADPGQTGTEGRTIYTRTPIRMTDTTTPQPSDVLFDPSGAAWQTFADGRWDEARGYAVTLTRAGRRGQAPWV
jgi:hypothetical protein